MTCRMGDYTPLHLDWPGLANARDLGGLPVEHGTIRQGALIRTESLTRLDNLATRIWCMVLDRLPAVEDHITEHSGLIRAILTGDAEAAESLAADHVGHFEQMVRAAL